MRSRVGDVRDLKTGLGLEDWIYCTCNRFDQRVARQQLCKQSNTHAVNNTVEVSSMWSVPRNSRLLLLGNGAVNIPSQQYLRRDVFYAVRPESI
jgi:hypothetical protein